MIMVETLKDYAIKALVYCIDHLGSVAYKITTSLDEKIGDVSAIELQFSCSEQDENMSRIHQQKWP
ncbi:Protein abil2 [Turnera subulata]|uniref:Protein abil2 n=1 Tax=Turnera subulata TaxID=218843 RepID=A0A9Q0FQV6_9ROSI|nr:Protein abil2 [Turnera subulata]